MNKKQKAIIEARNLLRRKEKAILSTHSASREGYPFGSMTTYMSDLQGHCIIYVSDLAQHTKNILNNPKISIIISEDNEKDINAGARLTILGDAEVVAENELAEISEQFWARFPESRKYQNTHDFKFYRIRSRHVRYIGGFGQIYWLTLDKFLLDEPEWKPQAEYAIKHMNEDHVDAMQLMLEHQFHLKADTVEMTHIYPDGFLLKANSEHNYFLPSLSLIIESKNIRTELVKMTHVARDALQNS